MKIIVNPCNYNGFNPFAPGHFAEKCILKLVEWLLVTVVL